MAARFPRFGKAFEFFTALFSNSGVSRNGFYPVQIGGYAAPPINAASSQTGGIITPQLALQISACWSCVWLIADTISTLPFILNVRSGNNRWGKPAYDHPTFAVLNRKPNSIMTSVDYWQFMIASELLWGNAYSEIVRNKQGDCVALLPLLPQFMVPYRAPTDGTLRYRYIPTGLMNDPSQDFAAADIFHIKDRSLDGMIGLSRIEYARNSLGLSQASEQASSDTYRNGMRSSGFLMYDKVLKKEQRDMIKTSLDSFKTGGPDASSFMVLEAGMKFEQLNMTPQDVALLSSRQFSVEDICRWYGVPPVLIGHAAAGVTSWGTGIEQLLLGFQSLTLRPYIRRIEAACGRSLLNPGDQATMYLTVDTDDLLGADSTARAALYSQYAQNGIMTRNEIRAQEDREPLEGGDDLTVQSNLVPISKLGEMGGAPTPPTHVAPPGGTPLPPGAPPPPAQVH